MYRQSEKNLLNSNTSSTFPDNMVNFSLLTAEICWRVWGTPANFNGFRVLAALLHGTSVVGVSQTLWHWTEGATYIQLGGHHVGHWPTFLVSNWFAVRPQYVHLMTRFSPHFAAFTIFYKFYYYDYYYHHLVSFLSSLPAYHSTVSPGKAGSPKTKPLELVVCLYRPDAQPTASEH